MSDSQAIADRVEIEGLRGEFTDAGMMRDYDRFASLFTPDARVADPRRQRRVGRPAGDPGRNRAAGRISGTISCRPRTPAPPARGRHRVRPCVRPEFRTHARRHSHLNYSVYHDRYRRTPDGWKFAERVDEVLYLDTTPLTGSPPHATSESKGES